MRAKDTPIITSLMEPDFYKFTMGQFVWKRYKDVQVTSRLRNRTKGVNLGAILDLSQVREELDHVRTLRFSNSDLHYLRGTNEYQDRMFCEPYLQFLKGLQLPEYQLEARDGDLILEFPGAWAEQIYWETIGLSIVNELYGRKLLEPLSRFERDAAFATGRLRLKEKIRVLREHPRIKFSDFGTRRRFSREWQRYVVEVMAAELPKQFLGTSNTLLAMELGLMPMGTSAHELAMVIAGLHDKGEDSEPNWLAAAQNELVNAWWEDYGYGLSIFLPDTFGTEFFLKNLPQHHLRNWRGFRQDSGDPKAFADRIILNYLRNGIGPTGEGKLLIPSDGLNVQTMAEIDKHTGCRIFVSDGWGTNLTNDLFDDKWHDGLWYGPLSLVVKAVKANGRGLVKLSDNLAKATGEPDDIERYKIAAGYTNTTYEECKY